MVKKKKYSVVWSNQAKNQLKEAYKFIKKDSLQNAIMVRAEIVSSTRLLKTGTQIYQADELKLRVRHSSRDPLEY